VNDLVPHPWVSGWLGERAWSSPEETPSSFVSFNTDADPTPFKITHNRDMMFDGDQLQQDYNFIDYWFGDPAAPYRARHYLGDDEVSIFLTEKDGIPITVEAALTLLPNDVLDYCRRRFGVVKVLTQDGYVEIESGGA
jgi:hypothetical protein